MVEEVRSKITEIHSTQFKLRKKVHQSELYTGISNMPIVPNLNMSVSRLLCRHIATVLLYGHSEMVEVQVAVNHEEGELYVANNCQKKLMENLLPAKLSELIIPDIPRKHNRAFRHAQKLKDEKKKFGDYKLFHVWVKSGRHAETEIVSVVKAFDYIAGTRRPCVACFIYMKIKEVSSDKYNSHHGAYWNSNCALLSLEGYAENISETCLDESFYYNQGLNGNEQFDYDTESE